MPNWPSLDLRKRSTHKQWYHCWRQNILIPGTRNKCNASMQFQWRLRMRLQCNAPVKVRVPTLYTPPQANQNLDARTSLGKSLTSFILHKGLCNFHRCIQVGSPTSIIWIIFSSHVFHKNNLYTVFFFNSYCTPNSFRTTTLKGLCSSRSMYVVAWTVPSIQKSMPAERTTCNDLIDLLEGSNLP